jgi:hypothetical protein
VLIRRLCCLFAIVLSVVLGAPIASADRPTIDPVNNPDQTIAGICPFTVFAHFDVDREKVITFSNGNFLITGALKVTLTTSTGKTLSVNVSGPVRFVFDANGDLTIYAAGRGFGPLGDGLFLGSGLVIIGATSVETHGHFVDLCALLA